MLKLDGPNQSTRPAGCAVSPYLAVSLVHEACNGHGTVGLMLHMAMVGFMNHCNLNWLGCLRERRDSYEIITLSRMSRCSAGVQGKIEADCSRWADSKVGHLQGGTIYHAFEKDSPATWIVQCSLQAIPLPLLYSFISFHSSTLRHTVWQVYLVALGRNAEAYVRRVDCKG